MVNTKRQRERERERERDLGEGMAYISGIGNRPLSRKGKSNEMIYVE